MQEYIPGQRWISDADTQLGLGTVLEVEARTVTLVYMASGETRTYARHSAPLTRVIFGVGDQIKLQSGLQLQVTEVNSVDGLLVYRGIDAQQDSHQVAETELDHFLQLDRPSERLFNAQIDRDADFELRYSTLQHINRLHHSELYGLTGVRTQLIPHQLYIAHEVARRYAPRVLLADEVGLGKTIEAGLILHHQLLTERAQRVLILLPESLLHQWLVEMLRRFNLMFSIFDEQRCQAIEEHDPQLNPFLTEQQVMCSIEFISAHPQRLQQCLAGEWDLLVVDEAHHLAWTPEQASAEYLAVERLASSIRGVLLLTATPEQLGKQSHFARLRLLDPDRYPDYQRFAAEEDDYAELAETVQQLLAGPEMDESLRQRLHNLLHDSDMALETALQDTLADETTRRQLVDQLLDRHGTGRVLFRNTRSAVQGFPQRHLQRFDLPLPDAYREALESITECNAQTAHLCLCPEQLLKTVNPALQDEWIELDPRIDLLIEWLSEHPQHKLLVIAAHAQTAMDIAQRLKTRSQINASVFHEQMSIVERDRAAAYFADEQQGAQVLICSEIGSEGRNFQFAHHLFLFDLPLHPDLLEQRIGRLDRIGQQFDIDILVPCFDDSAQALMLDWYHQALNAFEQTCPAGHSVFEQQQHRLIEAICGFERDPVELLSLIDDAAAEYKRLSEALHRGRDPLLEYNSCRPHLAEALVHDAAQQDRHNYLPEYMELALDCLDIEADIYRSNSLLLHPANHSNISLPGLDEDGLPITYDRHTALSHEDLEFVTWEHPLLTGIMDQVLSRQTGNTALTAIQYQHARPGSLLLEAVFVLETASHSLLQSQRYLPPTPLRIVIDEQGRDHAEHLPHAFIKKVQTRVDKGTAIKVVDAKRDALRSMIKRAEQRAEQQTPEVLDDARVRSEQLLQGEVQRLQALARVNPHVRSDEIEFFQQQQLALAQLLDHARLRLDALRVIVVAG